MQKRRYPGVSPFTSEQKDIFFGRDEDIQKLQKFISLRSQLLLYAKSGVGKTSLLNAGVLPKLEKDFIIIKVRFNTYNDMKSDTYDDKKSDTYNDKKPETPSQKVINILENSFKKIKQESIFDEPSVLNKIISTKKIEKTLWYYFKQIQLLSNEEEPIFLLVFDQFEELFSYPEEEIIEFKTQLQELINDNLPNEIKEFIDENPEKEDETEIIYDELNTKTVFSIRSDRLNLLNRLTDKLPNIQKNFYELKALNSEQAKQAIIRPAQDLNKFDTPSFEYENSTIEKIINKLSDNGEQNIETTQLQIVCQRIEGDILLTGNKGKGSTVTSKNLPEFKDIFLNFYESSVYNVVESLKLNDKLEEDKLVALIQKFIEDQLIRNNQRISLDSRICPNTITPKILRALTNTHLLRAEENSTSGISYELSHDTLIEPILDSRKKRIRKEEEEKEKSIRKESEEKKERQRDEKEKEQDKKLALARIKAAVELAERNREKKRQRTFIIIISIALFVSIGFGIFGYKEKNKAIKSAEVAINLSKEAKKREAKLMNSYLNFYLLKAKKFFNESKYDLSLEAYTLARDSVSTEYYEKHKASYTKVLSQIEVCKSKIKKEPLFENLMQQAAVSLTNNKYKETFLFYTEALEMQINNAKVITQLKNLLSKVEKASSIAKKNADAYETAGNSNKKRKYRRQETSLKELSTEIKTTINK